MTLGDKIRAMQRANRSTYDVEFNAALDRAAALADEHEATIAAAYEAAIDACSDYPRIAPDATEAQHYDEQIEHSQACIRALTPADARAALDRIKAEARKEGMRAADDWQSAPAVSPAWIAGCDFAMTVLCRMLKVDPHSISWDAATEELEGDVMSIIGNIMVAAFGEDWHDAILAAAEEAGK